MDDQFQVGLLGFLVDESLGFLPIRSLSRGQAQQQTAKKQSRSPDRYPHVPFLSDSKEVAIQVSIVQVSIVREMTAASSK
jgi:hypothetical protein